MEKEWSALRERSMKAISFVAQYSSLASRYQHLAERLRQGSSAREKEQRQVEQLEDAIAGMVDPWEQMLIRFSDHPGTCREIRDLLDSLGEGMQEIENDYLRGELDYDGVIQEMKSLQRRVRYYQVALDDEHAIDSAGRVTRRRQTERDSF